MKEMKNKLLSTITITLLTLSIFMAIIPIASSVSLSYFTAGTATHSWSSDFAKNGGWSVQLTNGVTDADAVKIDISITPILFSALSGSPSYWLYEAVVVAGGLDQGGAPVAGATWGGDYPKTGQDVPWGIPYINIWLDLDGDLATSDVFRLDGVGSSAGGATVAGVAVPHTAATWTQMEDAFGFYDWTSGFGDVYTLAQWQADLSLDSLTVHYPNALVTGVQIVYGWWKDACQIGASVYIDDLEVNGVTYPLEQSVGGTIIPMDKVTLLLTAFTVIGVVIATPLLLKRRRG